MANNTLGGKAETIETNVKVNTGKAKEGIKELQTLIDNLNKSVDATGKKFSAVEIKFNKMLASNLKQYDKLIKSSGAGNPESTDALAFIKNQSKQLNSLYTANPYRANAEAVKINRKIAADAAEIFSDKFAQNLSRSLYLKNPATVKGFDKGLYMTSSEYRGVVGKGFSDVEKYLVSKVSEGIDPERYTKRLQKLSNIRAQTIDPLNQSLKTQEKLKTVSGGALAFIQARLMANYAIINSVANAFSYLTNYVVEFDQELKNLQAIVNISDIGLENLRDSIIDVANSTKFTSLELTKAAVVLGQAGLSVQQIKDTLGPIAQLATATGTDLATSTQTITSALNIYNLQADEAAYITNALTTAMNESKAEIRGFQYALQYAGNTAANLNVSFEETAAATAALAQSGIKSVSTQGTGLRAVFTELIKPTKKFQDQLAKVGLTTADVDVKTKGFIPVLRTLKDAGFGVTEAYRGMERRGAAAMVAILNQVDFMDELTDKMSTSTAGIIANRTQMEGLKNTFLNTQSVVGSLASKAFDPLVRVLQSTLEGFNNLTKSVGGTIAAFSILLTTVSGVAAVTLKAATGMAAVAASFAKIEGMAKFFGSIAALGAGKLTLIVAALGALAVGIGWAAKQAGLFSDNYDEALGKLEESQGKLNKAEEGYKSFGDVIAKAYLQREKFIGPYGRKEVDKYVNMIVTRFPQIAHHFEDINGVWENLAKAMSEANKELAEFNRLSSQSLPRDAEKVTEAAIKDKYIQGGKSFGVGFNNEEEYYKLLDELKMLRDRGILTNDVSNQFLNGQLFRGDNSVNKFFKDINSGLFGDTRVRETLNKNAPEQFIAGLRASYATDPEKVGQSIRMALADGSLEFSEGLRTVLSEFLKEIEVKEKANDTKLNSLLTQDLSPVSTSTLDVYTSQLAGLKESYSQMLRNPNMSSEDFRKNFDSIRNQIEADYKKLSNEDASLYNQVADSIGFDKVQRYATLFTGGDTNVVMNQGIAHLKQTYSTIASEFLNFLSELENVSEDVSKAGVKEAENNASRRYKDKLKSLASTPINMLDEVTEKTEEEIRNRYEFLIAEAKKAAEGDAVKKSLLDTTVKEMEEKRDEEIRRFKSESESVKSTFDKNMDAERKYFETLQTTIDNITDSYEQKITYLDGKYAKLKGEGAAYSELGLFGGQDSVDYQLSQAQYGDDVVRLGLMRDALRDYEKQKTAIESKGDYQALAAKVAQAEAKLNSLLNDPNATQEDSDRARQVYDEAVAKQKKYTDVTGDLTEKITDLKVSIEELDAKVKTKEFLAGDGQVLESAKLGFNNAVNAYAKGNAYMGENKGGNFFVSQVIGETFYSTINEAESALANFFDVAISGTKSTGEAFKDMCRSILQAMQQALYSEMAKQFIALLFGGTQNGDAPGTGTSAVIQGITAAVGGAFSAGGIFGGGGVISESGGVTASATYTSGGQTIVIPGAAQGGIVRGGIKNRDSVPTMLMPGEFVLRKTAVDSLGTDFLARLNSGNANFMDMANQSIQKEGDNSNKKESTLNIWVVSQDQVPQENPENIILTVSKDIQTNGSIKQLIKQVSMGAL